MVEVYRTIRAFGECAPGTEYVVTVDEKPALRESNELFSFITSVALHGSCTVKIEVKSGNLKMNRWTATYPALFNGVPGYAVFKQPIVNPIALFDNNQLQEFSEISVNENEIFEYEHMMFNGPTKFIISIDREINEGDTIIVGDLVTLSFTPGIVVNDVEHDYNKYPNDVCLSSDLEVLKNIVIEKFRNKLLRNN